MLQIQYAKAMGMHVAAVDLGPEKMALARKLVAGGANGVLVTAVSTIAFRQAIGMLRRGGTCVLKGLPPGDFPVSIIRCSAEPLHHPRFDCWHAARFGRGAYLWGVYAGSQWFKFRGKRGHQLRQCDPSNDMDECK